MSGSEVQEIAKLAVPKNAIDLSPEVIQGIRYNLPTTGPIMVPGWVGSDGLVELFGIRQCRDGEIPDFYFGSGKDKTSYVGDYNQSNRNWLQSNHEKLLKEMHSDRWVSFSPETWIFGLSGMCLSAQHRGFAAFCKCKTDATFRIGIWLYMGFPDELADVLDRQAQRRNKEIIQRHSADLLPPELLIDTNGLQFPKANEVAAKLAGEVNSLLRTVSLRAHASDVKAGGAFSQTEMGEMLTRCPWAGELVAQVYRHTLGSDGKPIAAIKLWSRPLIGAMLVLAANTDNPPKIGTAGRSRQFVLPDIINRPSDEIVEGFCSVLGRVGDGAPLQPLYTKMGGWSDKHPQRRASALVAVLRHFLKTRTQQEIPVPIDATTGQPLPGQSPEVVWTCPPISPEQADPGTLKEGVVFKWFNFGGLDVGYLPPLAKD